MALRMQTPRYLSETTASEKIETRPDDRATTSKTDKSLLWRRSMVIVGLVFAVRSVSSLVWKLRDNVSREGQESDESRDAMRRYELSWLVFDLIMALGKLMIIVFTAVHVFRTSSKLPSDVASAKTMLGVVASLSSFVQFMFLTDMPDMSALWTTGIGAVVDAIRILM